MFGPESSLVELPVSWYLDDFPQIEYITGIQEGQKSVETVFNQWKSIFDYEPNIRVKLCLEHIQKGW